MSDLVGQQLGQYQLREVIRRGGMATVYKAWQPSLHRWVAIKVLAQPGDPEFLSRFKLEARSIAQLQHPNILPIHDYGEQDDQAYLVVQYIEDGRTLGDLMDGPLELARSLQLTIHLLGALGYAHDRGIVHRDVKPGNVLMPSETWPMLADFGIAKLLLGGVGQEKLTRQGLVVGTAAYMAPEQAFGLDIDARTDLYSSGIVLFELLTGQVPFEADTPVATLMKQAYEAPPPPRELRPDLPAEVERVLLRVLAKEPGERYPSAAEMAADLQAVLSGMRHAEAAPPDPLADAYATGVRAFSAGRWDEALANLGQVAATDPEYEDVEALLEATTEARERELRKAAPMAPAVDAAPAVAGVPLAGVPADPAEPVPAEPVAAAPAPAAKPARLSAGAFGWLVVVVLIAALGLSAPVVMIRRSLAEPAASEGAAATGSTVSMAGLAFQPESLTVPAGTEVVFRNDDVAPHTVTDSGGEFDSGILAPGASFTLRVDNSFDYVCTIHPSMKARVALSA